MADENQQATEDPDAIFDRLAEPFPAHCVEWLPKTVTMGRDGGRALALCYIDARSVMARLDEVIGPRNWRDSYRVEGNRTVCRIEILLNTGAGPVWVGKEDVSGDTGIEAEKGGASGAFKRAGVKWGIGRYLYDVDEVWADCEAYEKGQKNGKKVWGFRKWTRDGLDDLAAALDRAPGPRETGNPPAIEDLLDRIARCDDFPELRRMRIEHAKSVPLEYRAKVMRAFEARKNELEERDAARDERRDEGEGE